MLVLLGIALVFQGSPGPPVQQGEPTKLTADILESAFTDPTARSILVRARRARMTEDSTLTAYDAMSYQRISAGLGFRSIGRDRLLFRHESAARVRWQQGIGAWIDATASRTVIPLTALHGDGKVHSRMSDPDLYASIPYFPGNEPLWIGGGIARSTIDRRGLIHPLAEGAEAYYTYATGDSITLELPNVATIRLIELEIRPREPKWNLATGSLWLDASSGQLVRAAYRLAAPIDLWVAARDADSTSMDDFPGWVRSMITPMKAEVAAVVIEYGLHDGRFWLPRLRIAEGSAHVGFMRVPFKLEERFTYSSVNGADSLPSIAAEPARPHIRDLVNPEERAKWRDSVRRGLRTRDYHRACDTSDTRVVTSSLYDARLVTAMRIPCDLSKLENSPDLPASIYDANEKLFGADELEALKGEALALSAQGPLLLGRPGARLPRAVFAYGPSLMRYNRIEGLSLGGSVEQDFGGGYAGTALARIGSADREPNFELAAARSNVEETIGARVYNRLVSANDWGHPLSFSSSVSALLFARDEGFYYRATGIEVSGDRAAEFGGGTRVEWRAFSEQQRTAAAHTSFAFSGGAFPANVLARRGWYSGVGIDVANQHGLDPAAFRLFTDLRMEAAAGQSTYGRGAVDLTGSKGVGPIAGSLTISGGSSVGSLPPQRNWFLGGLQTVRGQSPDTTQAGDAYWLTRFEIGQNTVGVRPTVFGDLGWVGDRTKILQKVRPMSGVGAGLSFADGLLRLDVARGIYPRKQFRVDVSLEAMF